MMVTRETLKRRKHLVARIWVTTRTLFLPSEGLDDLVTDRIELLSRRRQHGKGQLERMVARDANPLPVLDGHMARHMQMRAPGPGGQPAQRRRLHGVHHAVLDLDPLHKSGQLVGFDRFGVDADQEVGRKAVLLRPDIGDVRPGQIGLPLPAGGRLERIVIVGVHVARGFRSRRDGQRPHRQEREHQTEQKPARRAGKYPQIGHQGWFTFLTASLPGGKPLPAGLSAYIILDRRERVNDLPPLRGYAILPIAMKRTLMPTFLDTLHALALMLWLGGIVVIGAIVAPAAFHVAGLTKMQAGSVVGESLRRLGPVIEVGGLVMVAVQYLERRRYLRSRALFLADSVRQVLTLGALLLAEYGKYVLFPALDSARAANNLASFDRFHHLYSALAMVQVWLLLGVAVLTAWLQLPRITPAPATAAPPASEPAKPPATRAVRRAAK